MDNRFSISRFLANRKVQIQHSRHKPDFVIFPLLARPWELLPLPEAHIVWQTVDMLGLHLLVVEIDATHALSLPYTVLAHTGSLLVTLRGALNIHNSDAQQIARIDKPGICLSYDPLGDYVLHIEKGLHSFIILSFEREWILDSQEIFPAFTSLGTVWHNNSPVCMLLPTVPLTNALQQALERIRLTNVQLIKDVAYIMEQLDTCLRIYHRKLVEKKDEILANISHLGPLLQEYLNNHYTDPAACTFEAIGRKLKRKKWALNKIAQLHLGCSIQSYVTRLRMEIACGLLLDTEVLIGQIALELGYSDTSHFSKTFKQYTGKKPADYRRDGG